MCHCMSFLYSKTGEMYYITEKQEKDFIKRIKSGKPDSHSSIASYYGINEDKMNKYEYNIFTKELEESNVVFDTDVEKVKKVIENKIPKTITNYWKRRAVQQDGLNIRYIKNPSAFLKTKAVEQNSYSIGFIKNPSEKLQQTAIKNKEGCLKLINVL